MHQSQQLMQPNHPQSQQYHQHYDQQLPSNYGATSPNDMVMMQQGGGPTPVPPPSESWC